MDIESVEGETNSLFVPKPADLPKQGVGSTARHERGQIADHHHLQLLQQATRRLQFCLVKKIKPMFAISICWTCLMEDSPEKGSFEHHQHPRPPSSAIDGDLETYWATETGYPSAEFHLDLGTSMQVMVGTWECGMLQVISPWYIIHTKNNGKVMCDDVCHHI